jgi:uncharacterized membrane protein HdeD (DUF308 family)
MNESTEISRELRWSIVVSVLMIVAGILVIIVPPVSGIAVTILVGWLFYPVAGLGALTLMLAVYLFLEAILEFILSFELRALRGSGWLLVDGIITLILAIMIWRTWPASTMWVIGTLVGISIVFSGVTRLMLTLAARHVADALQQEPKPVRT